ncbi:hypothetical protein J2T60_001946 [Natronospira proteinivora]|uniref:Cytochrome oxidase Cu insertion factor (SCO1/SenC/PrrC family) n=1 Tax=Natronospira proteinivora TaxID=1807133 RepID=A0ABT1G9E6_9GAMM|nr:hypothetical protein [Natronospira proteinivora]MCP1727946.1 hypothetical protein [Natronospira proteinivora]
MTVDPKTRRFRFTLILVFLVCVGPFILAWLFFAFRGAPEITDTTNKGELIHPAQPLEDVTLPALASREELSERPVLDGRKWTVVYLAADGCGADCREVLWGTRQIRLSLGRDMGRVQRVLLTPENDAQLEFFREEHADLTVFPIDHPAAEAFLEQFELEDGQVPAESGRLYIVDPLDNLMMYFPPGFDPDDFMDDMRRLLRASQIG